MQTIKIKGEFLFELASKQDWIYKVPGILPNKIRPGESWIWIDKNGNVFECGADFTAAENHCTYPCKVYRLSNVASAYLSTAKSKHLRVDDISQISEGIEAFIKYQPVNVNRTIANEFEKEINKWYSNHTAIVEFSWTKVPMKNHFKFINTKK